MAQIGLSRFTLLPCTLTFDWHDDGGTGKTICGGTEFQLLDLPDTLLNSKSALNAYMVKKRADWMTPIRRRMGGGNWQPEWFSMTLKYTRGSVISERIYERGKRTR